MKMRKNGRLGCTMALGSTLVTKGSGADFDLGTPTGLVPVPPVCAEVPGSFSDPLCGRGRHLKRLCVGTRCSAQAKRHGNGRLAAR